MDEREIELAVVIKEALNKESKRNGNNPDSHEFSKFCCCRRCHTAAISASAILTMGWVSGPVQKKIVDLFFENMVKDRGYHTLDEIKAMGYVKESGGITSTFEKIAHSKDYYRLDEIKGMKDDIYGQGFRDGYEWKDKSKDGFSSSLRKIGYYTLDDIKEMGYHQTDYSSSIKATLERHAKEQGYCRLEEFEVDASKFLKILDEAANNKGEFDPFIPISKVMKVASTPGLIKRREG